VDEFNQLNDPSGAKNTNRAKDHDLQGVGDETKLRLE
jgi:hypothetical protein